VLQIVLHRSDPRDLFIDSSSAVRQGVEAGARPCQGRVEGSNPFARSKIFNGLLALCLAGEPALPAVHRQGSEAEDFWNEPPGVKPLKRVRRGGQRVRHALRLISNCNCGSHFKFLA
jgi:hypothetical protein